MTNYTVAAQTPAVSTATVVVIVFRLGTNFRVAVVGMDSKDGVVSR